MTDPILAQDRLEAAAIRAASDAHFVALLERVEFGFGDNVTEGTDDV